MFTYMALPLKQHSFEHSPIRGCRSGCCGCCVGLAWKHVLLWWPSERERRGQESNQRNEGRGKEWHWIIYSMDMLDQRHVASYARYFHGKMPFKRLEVDLRQQVQQILHLKRGYKHMSKRRPTPQFFQGRVGEASGDCRFPPEPFHQSLRR